VCLHLTTGAGVELDNRATAALMAGVNDSGAAYLSHTAVDGRTLLRVSVGAPATAERHIDALLDALRSRADAAIAGAAG
jgi:aromatic-L-amino-acid decarboxylase